ncbi:hypothetical protein ACYAO4_004003 [Cronobacter turicensis]
MSEISKEEHIYRLANHIASSKNGLPEEWQPWADEIESDLRELLALRERAEPIYQERRFHVSRNKQIEYWAEINKGAYQYLPESERRIVYAEPPAPVVPEGLRIALSNAGIAAPESDEMLWASQQDYIQMLVTWVKDRKPFKPAPGVPEPVRQPYKLPGKEG